ncbi:MAG: hypothetical protein OEZ14_02280 [Acidimicrobiia bacterium]|nr:hypothetical protein [Acidimicrobiia bacterium]MDH5519338.1 hypothetical protein [Acidimicrobiia bacterium]
MGPTGANKEVVQLARSLESDGCTVHTFDSMPVEVAMTKFDMAVLVVTDNDPLSIESTDHRIQRILHAAGFLEARLARDRVCLLVEDAVNELQAPPVTQIRYPTGDPMGGKGELVKFIQAQYPRVHRDLHRQIPIREQAQSDELRMPWAMLIAVALAALIPIVLLARSLGGGDDTDTLAGVADSLESGQLAGPSVTDDSADGASTGSDADTGDDLGVGAGSDATGSGDGGAQLGESEGSSVGSDGGSGAGEATDATGEGASAGGGSGQSNTDDGGQSSTSPTLTRTDSGDSATQSTSSAARLPAICTVDLRKSLVLRDAYVCDNGGVLVTEGFEGPWHNEISEVALSTGATGTLVYEIGRDLPLQAGNIVLDQANAQYGVNTITVVFSAEGQHLHFYQRPERGANSATLTFSLG